MLARAEGFTGSGYFAGRRRYRVCRKDRSACLPPAVLLGGQPEDSEVQVWVFLGALPEVPT